MFFSKKMSRAHYYFLREKERQKRRFRTEKKSPDKNGLCFASKRSGITERERNMSQFCCVWKKRYKFVGVIYRLFILGFDNCMCYRSMQDFFSHFDTREVEKEKKERLIINMPCTILVIHKLFFNLHESPQTLQKRSKTSLKPHDKIDFFDFHVSILFIL